MPYAIAFEVFCSTRLSQWQECLRTDSHVSTETVHSQCAVALLAHSESCNFYSCNIIYSRGSPTYFVSGSDWGQILNKKRAMVAFKRINSKEIFFFSGCLYFLPVFYLFRRQWKSLRGPYVGDPWTRVVDYQSFVHLAQLHLRSGFHCPSLHRNYNKILYYQQKLTHFVATICIRNEKLVLFVARYYIESEKVVWCH